MSTEDLINLDTLHKNALWVIMDPWYPHPWKHDVVADPKINERTQIIVDKIVDYLPNLKHVLVSCPKRFPVHTSLQHLENYYNETIGNDSEQADIKCVKYMKEHNIKDIVYIGFHLGRCILNKNIGAKTMSQGKARCWMKRDLVGMLITDNEEFMLTESKKYLSII